MTQAILRVEKVPEMLVQKLSSDYEIYEYNTMSTEAFEDIANNIHIVLASGESKVNAELIEKLPNLKLIAVFGVGYDGVDLTAAFARHIQVTNTPGVLTDDVADLGIGLIIAASRQLIGAQRFIEQGHWENKAYKLTTKVSGSKLGIVGFGRVGQAVAKRAEAFNMVIAYCDKSPIENFSYTYYSDLHKLAHDSDFLIICASGGNETAKLINHSILQSLGEKGFLINIARGSVVDEDALAQAIENNSIAGAALDVFAHEPHVPSRLQNRDNVILTPHIASATTSTRQAMADLVCNNIHAYCAGKPLITPVKK